ncbi:transglycosylase SLT domain-containing protein [Streptomyces sp. NPDC005385]|uniref:transglycosylase SLT domain-containing protein n=1 Tax=Streptomyces sp. NPDC005385 TaxID=3157039 RepID=UPI0033B320D3
MSPAISVGSVEVDVIPNAQGVRQRLQQQLLPAADSVGDEIGRILGRYVTSHVASGLVQGITTGGRQAQAAAVRQGSSTGSTFARSFKSRLEASLANLPEVRLTANSSDAEREIYQIRAQLTALKDTRIGIDVSSADATAAMDHIRERLARLSASDADIAIRVDAGAAQAQLAAFQAEINRLDGQDIDVDADVDTAGAVANINALRLAGIALGPAILPAIPVIVAGIGAIASAAVAAGAGMGALGLVAVPAIKQIGSVLQLQKAAQDAASQSTNNGAQAAAQAASRADQLASAQAGLATAERNGAKQIAAAQAQVASARKNVSTVTAQAALRSQQAARQVQDAERALADAQKSAKQAQDDLTAARRTAAQELEDLDTRLTDSKLSQRDAEIALKEATAARDAVMKNANSTDLDKEKALLAYDQAVQRLKEQTTETTRLSSETKKANAAGVEGSKTVKDAQAQVAQAQQGVVDKTRALKDAQQDQARTASQNAADIADAQQRVAEAQKGVGEAQVSAAESAASAQRQLQSAMRQTVGGVDQAAAAQARYQAELAKLSPAARATMNAYTGLRSAFSAWSMSLQPAVMPIFTRALNAMKGALPGLTPLVHGAADAITELMDRASAEFKKPFWKTFKDDLDTSVKPAIVGLGVAFGNVFKGIAGIIGAFLPHMGDISTSLQKITKKFADWGAGLRGSPQFENFLSYSSRMAPVVGKALGDIFTAVVKIGKAIAPVSVVAYKLISILSKGIGWIADNAPYVAQGIYAIILAVEAWKVATWVWAGVQWLANAALTAFQLIAAAGPWGWLAIAIALVVVAIVLLWKKCDWFRNSIKAVWSAIKIGGQAVADWFTDKFVPFFTKTIPAVFRVLLDWVKRNWPWILGALTGPIGLAVVYIVKHWGQIRKGISDAWGAIKRTTLYPIRDFFTKTIPSWGTTLKNNLIGAFDAARIGIKTAWEKIREITRKPVQYVVDAVYNDGIRKVWNLVTDAFGGKHLNVMKFATGGVLPGYTPGKDVHQFTSPTGGMLGLSGGEAIMRPEWTRAVGPAYVAAMNAAARNGGVGGVRAALGFKDGGIFSGIGDALGSAWDKVKAGTSWLTDSFGSAVKAGVNHVVNPLIGKIPGGQIGFTGLLKDLMKGAVKGLLGAGKEGDKKASPVINYKPSAGVEQWRPVVLKALAEVGQPRGLAQSTLRRMQQESGGNPTIVNKWDSNWQAGHPSVGLMQVIGPTFRSHAGKYKNTGPFLYGTSVNPLANVYASMRYAMSAYGSLSRAYDRKGGYARGGILSTYDSGGYLPRGLNLVNNGTGRPEPVFTPDQARALTGAAFAKSGETPSLDGMSLAVYVGSEKIADIARAEIRDSNQQLISVLNAS